MLLGRGGVAAVKEGVEESSLLGWSLLPSAVKEPREGASLAARGWRRIEPSTECPVPTHGTDRKSFTSD